MALRADVNMRFYMRFAIIGGVCLIFCLWSLYDGLVTYPEQRERALKYAEYREQDKKEEWKALAAERGWHPGNPGEPKSEADIMGQFVMAGVTGTLGLGFLIVVLRARGRWIEATDSGIRSSWGQELSFDQIVSINKRKWENKGIAKIRYKENGRTRRFTVDDFKFVREPTDEILRIVESRLDEDQIVGGPPEAAYDVDPESEQEASSTANADQDQTTIAN